MPLPPFDSKYHQLIQALPPDYADLARAAQSFTRARKLKSVEELLYTVLLYSLGDLTAREIAGFLTGCGIPLTDEAVRQRLAACPSWLKALLAKLLPTTPLPQRGAQPWRLILCDGSQISGPGARGTDYRWHLAYDPVAQAIDQLCLSDAHTSESLSLFTLGPGDLVLADRGFAKAAALIETRERGAHVVVRMTTHYLKLWTREGEAFDLVGALRQVQDQSQVSFALTIRDPRRGRQMPVWIHAHHLSEPQIERAHRRLKRRARRRGCTPRAQTLLLSEWVLVLTTVPPEELAAEVILELYLVRWQVELVIKRYKSLLGAARVRAKAGSPLAEVYLLGKLVCAVLIERFALARLGREWGQMNGARRITWWRVWKLIACEVKEAVLHTASWSGWDWRAVLHALAERKRRRQLQVIPAAVAEWLKTTPLAAARQAT